MYFCEYFQPILPLKHPLEFILYTYFFVKSTLHQEPQGKTLPCQAFSFVRQSDQTESRSVSSIRQNMNYYINNEMPVNKVPKLFNAATFEESLLQNNEYSFFVQQFSSVMWCRQIFCSINNYGDNSQTCMSHF